MKNYLLLLFIASLSLNTTSKTLSLKTKVILGSVSAGVFAAYKAYKRLYNNSFSVLKNDANKAFATTEWHAIPFFKRFFITKKHFGLWTFESLATIASPYTYYEKEINEINPAEYEEKINTWINREHIKNKKKQYEKIIIKLKKSNSQQKKNSFIYNSPIIVFTRYLLI